MNRDLYESSIAYEEARIGAAAIYCSDGRVGAHFDDFLQCGLELPRYDRIALPGGPATLAGHGQARSVTSELRFLAEVHQLERVVLITHQGCAFYRKVLGLSGDELERAQLRDLRRAVDSVKDATGLSEVSGFFARLDADRVRFEPVAL